MTDGGDLRNLVQARNTAGLDPLLELLNGSLLPATILRYNSEFSVRYFGRPPSETVPTAPMLLTAFRSRLGGLIEYGLGVTLDMMIEWDYGDDLRLSFAVASEYPDFFLRDSAGDQLLRIDVKILHDESTEYSARFTLPQFEIRPCDDLLLYVAWKWTKSFRGDHELVHPEVLDGLFVPAIDIARERDLRTTLAGGTIAVDGAPLVPAKAGGLATDTNFGKINRIVHGTRRDSPDLSEHVRRFLRFTSSHAEAVAAAEASAASPTPDEIDPG